MLTRKWQFIKGWFSFFFITLSDIHDYYFPSSLSNHLSLDSNLLSPSNSSKDLLYYGFNSECHNRLQFVLILKYLHTQTFHPPIYSNLFLLSLHAGTELFSYVVNVFIFRNLFVPYSGLTFMKCWHDRLCHRGLVEFTSISLNRIRRSHFMYTLKLLNHVFCLVFYREDIRKNVTVYDFIIRPIYTEFLCNFKVDIK